MKLKFFIKNKKAVFVGILISIVTTFFILSVVTAVENSTLNLNFLVGSKNLTTYGMVTTLSSSQQLSKPLNITLIDHNTGEYIKSFDLSSISQSEQIQSGKRYDVFVVQGSEEIILDNNKIGYIAGDTVIIIQYCNGIACVLEDNYHLDAPWRVEPQSGNIPVFAIINTDFSAISCINVYDHNNADAYVSGQTYTSFIPANLPFSRTFYLDKSNFVKINGNISVEIKYCLDWYPDNWEGPIDIVIDTNEIPHLGNWYYGDTHYHSSYTNNTVEFGGTVENTVDAGKAIGLDWVTITDHSFDLETDEEWNNLVYDANSYSINNNFIAIANEEISCDNPGPGNYNHYLGYGISHRIFSGEYPDDFSSPLTCSNVIQQVNYQGGFGYIAHPFAKEGWGITYRNVWQDYSLDFNGLQVWNGKNDEGLWGSYTSWEELLSDGMDKWVELLKSGRHVFIEGGSDAHGNFNDGFGTVRTVVNTPSLSRNNILNAIRNGHSIMTDGPIAVFDIANENNERKQIGDNITGSHLTLNMEWKSTPEFGNVDQIYLYRGTILENEVIELAFFPNASENLWGTKTYNLDSLPLNKDSYIRLYANTDKGYRVYTNPIFVRKISPTGTISGTVRRW